MTAAEREKGKATCGDNKECLFDYAVTGMSTLKIFHDICNHDVLLSLIIMVTNYSLCKYTANYNCVITGHKNTPCTAI